LRLAARLWNPAEPKKSLVDFQSMMDSMNKFYPNYEDSTNLIQVWFFFCLNTFIVGSVVPQHQQFDKE
jgi:hypothetical protein